jgi:hypothetical protein
VPGLRHRSGCKTQALRAPAENGTGSLTTGKLNAVRAAFKAGVRPSSIARQFGISQSDVGKALATEGEPGSPGAEGRGGFGCAPIANSFAGALTQPQGMVKMVHSGRSCKFGSRSSHAKRLHRRAAPTQTKLSRNSNQIARGRIRKFESYMPSQAVWSPRRKMYGPPPPCRRGVLLRKLGRIS